MFSVIRFQRLLNLLHFTAHSFNKYWEHRGSLPILNTQDIKQAYMAYKLRLNIIANNVSNSW